MESHFIIESEAARLAGVSVRTLQRFIEQDTLAARPADNGAFEIDAQSLAQLFKIDVPLGRQDDPVRSQAQESSQAEELPHCAEIPLTPITSRTFRSETPTENGHLVSLLERLLDERESEISELRKERDWLRQRVERAEEKQDRDQLLLLSKTQVMQQLITRLDRPTTMQRMLSWLGIEQSPPRRGPSFEVRLDAPKSNDQTTDPVASKE